MLLVVHGGTSLTPARQPSFSYSRWITNPCLAAEGNGNITAGDNAQRIRIQKSRESCSVPPER